MNNKKRILCIIGPSGSGKTTIEEKLCEDFPNLFHRIVSYTTRPMREGERQGVEHKFVDSCDAKEAEMLAYTKYGDYEYWAEEKDLAPDVINTYVIDVDGYEYLKKHFGEECDIKVMFINRYDLSGIDKDRRNRDSTITRLRAIDIDFLYINYKSLLGLSLDIGLIATNIIQGFE